MQILFVICVISSGAVQGALDSSIIREAQDDEGALRGRTDAAAGWLIFVSVVGIIYVIIFILQRFINVKLLNDHILIVLIVVRPFLTL